MGVDSASRGGTMQDSTSGRSTSDPVRTALIVYWRLERPDSQILCCTSYRTASGLELRAGVEGEPSTWSERVESHAAALQLAIAWKEKVTSSQVNLDPR